VSMALTLGCRRLRYAEDRGTAPAAHHLDGRTRRRSCTYRSHCHAIVSKQTSRIVVTHEIRNPARTTKLPTPNVGDAFGVHPINTFEMLRMLGVAYK
jgi:hypothetical protein